MYHEEESIVHVDILDNRNAFCWISDHLEDIAWLLSTDRALPGIVGLSRMRVRTYIFHNVIRNDACLERQSERCICDEAATLYIDTRDAFRTILCVSGAFHNTMPWRSV